MNTNITTNVLLQWSAPERPAVERGRVWYAVIGLSALIAAIWSIVTAAWTFTIVIILGGAMYYQRLKSHIARRRIEVRKEGFAVDDVCTPWDQCSGFRIYKHGKQCTLHIEKNRGWDREIVTEIEGLDERDVATLLSAFLPYQATRRENLLDYIIRICKL